MLTGQINSVPSVDLESWFFILFSDSLSEMSSQLSLSEYSLPLFNISAIGFPLFFFEAILEFKLSFPLFLLSADSRVMLLVHLSFVLLFSLGTIFIPFSMLLRDETESWFRGLQWDMSGPFDISSTTCRSGRATSDTVCISLGGTVPLERPRLKIVQIDEENKGVDEEGGEEGVDEEGGEEGEFVTVTKLLFNRFEFLKDWFPIFESAVSGDVVSSSSRRSGSIF